MSIRIERFKGMNRTPALALASAGQAHLTAAGILHHALISWEDEAVVAFDGEEAIGVISFNDREWAKDFSISMGYVLPDHRRKGVYRLLFDTLVTIAQERGRIVISSGTHIDNAAMRAAAKSQGRREVGVMLEFDVQPAGETP